MVSDYPASSNPDSSNPTWATLTESRSELIRKLKRKSVCDILIVGGGIAGASLARLAAFNGVRVTLLERGDYASATSGRSSKMAHGGLRYLEMLDFAQVREGVLCRDELFRSAPHLVRPHPFMIPVKRGDLWSRLKYRLGLSLYDLLAHSPAALRHRWITHEELGSTPLRSCQESLSGAFEFIDGVMDDARLVLENVIAARQEGAICLNYAEFISYEIRRDRSVVVTWRDRLDGREHSLTTGIIANCAGPWVTSLGRITQSPELGEVAYSRGVHLLFSTPWNGPALLLPMPERGRVYFIWPHPGGTLVGTTEASTPQPEWDPIPTRQEIEEILSRLDRDLPAAGLNRQTLHYAFAGIRTLPLKRTLAKRLRNVSRISRRHRWVHTPGMLSLLGGKLTSASWATREGLAKIFKLSDVVSPLISIDGRKYPGGWGLEQASQEFRIAAKKAGVPDSLCEAALLRFGARVSQFALLSNPYQVLGGCILRGEVELATRTEQVEDLQDLMGRRLGLEFHPGNGLEALDAIGDVVEEVFAETKTNRSLVSEQKERYRLRIAAMTKLLSTT